MPGTKEYGRYLLVTTKEDGGYRGSITRKDGQFLAFETGAIARELFTPKLYEREEDALKAVTAIADSHEEQLGR